MKVKDLIEEIEDVADFEVWQYTDKSERLHTDFIRNLDSVYYCSAWQNLEVKAFYIMDEKEYNETILCNSSEKADFKEWYGEDCNKLLVIMIGYDDFKGGKYND